MNTCPAENRYRGMAMKLKLVEFFFTWKFFRRTVSLAVAWIFLVTTAAWSVPDPVMVTAGSGFILKEPVRDLGPLSDRLEIPDSLGQIEGRFVPAQTLEQIDFPTVVHIQDAHGSYDAQKKIKGMIQYLRANYGFDLVLVEGAAGHLNQDLMRFFTDPSFNDRLADHLAQSGELGGAELYLIGDDPRGDTLGGMKLRNKEFKTVPTGTIPKVEAYGIERDDLYWENLLDFRRVISRKPFTDRFLFQVKSALNLLGSHYFNPDLRNFLKDWLLYQDEQTEILRHLDVLKTTALKELDLDLEDVFNQKEWPALLRFFKLKTLEKSLDLEQVTKEKDRLMIWLKQNKINEEFAGGIENLISDGTGSLEGRYPAIPVPPRTGTEVRRFLERFYEKAAPLGFRFEGYPVLSRTIAFGTLREEIEPGDLFAEIDRLTDLILGRLVKSSKEKKLVSYFQDYQRLRKLFSLELARDEFESLRQKGWHYRPSRWWGHLLQNFENHKVKLNLQDLGGVDEAYGLALKFYANALRRDDAMVENVLHVMKEKGKTQVIMITGGFHTPGLLSRLKDQGVAYVEVTPRISGPESRDNYLRSMMGRIESQSAGRSKIKNPLYLVRPQSADLRTMVARIHRLGFNSQDLIQIPAEEMLTDTRIAGADQGRQETPALDFLKLQTLLYQENQIAHAVFSSLDEELQGKSSSQPILDLAMDLNRSAQHTQFNFAYDSRGKMPVYRFQGPVMHLAGQAVEIPVEVDAIQGGRPRLAWHRRRLVSVRPDVHPRGVQSGEGDRARSEVRDVEGKPATDMADKQVREDKSEFRSDSGQGEKNRSLGERYAFYRDQIRLRLAASQLFKSHEIARILDRLDRIHQALERWPLPLGVESPSRISPVYFVPTEEVLNLIVTSPVLLGIKPMSDVYVTQEGRNQFGKWLKRFNQSFGVRILYRSRRVHSPIYWSSGGLYPDKQYEMWIFDQNQMMEAVRSVKTKVVLRGFAWAGIFQVLQARETAPFIRRVMSVKMRISSAIGIFFGYPISTVAAFMRIRRDDEKWQKRIGKMQEFASRWGVLGDPWGIIKDTTAQPKLVGRTMDRFDATSEVMIDYLRDVCGLSLKERDLKRWLGIKSANGRPKTPALPAVELTDQPRSRSETRENRRIFDLDQIREAVSWKEFVGNEKVAWDIGYDLKALIKRATDSPDTAFLGIEIGISSISQDLQSLASLPRNVMFLHADIVELLDVLPESLRTIHRIYVDYPNISREAESRPEAENRPLIFAFEESVWQKLLRAIAPQGEVVLRTTSKEIVDAVYRAAQTVGASGWREPIVAVDHPDQPATGWSYHYQVMETPTYLVRYQRPVGPSQSGRLDSGGTAPLSDVRNGREHRVPNVHPRGVHRAEVRVERLPYERLTTIPKIEAPVLFEHGYYIQTSLAAPKIIIVTADHQQVVPGWREAQIDGVIPANASLLRMDAHRDHKIALDTLSNLVMIPDWKAGEVDPVQRTAYLAKVADMVRYHYQIDTFTVPEVLAGLIGAQKWFYRQTLDQPDLYQEQLVWDGYRVFDQPNPFKFAVGPRAISFQEAFGDGTIDILDIDIDICDPVRRKLIYGMANLIDKTVRDYHTQESDVEAFIVLLKN
ncbi:MAG: hypothetical protein NC930_07165, partial [Candidatus Omnitrophica bacterium]|nr:hypothetical protein [Candidatus Omnitrophota bacterium]